METNTIEQRLATLENEVAELKRKLTGESSNGKTASWVDEIAGSMKDIPQEDYDEFLRCCKEFRNSQQDPY